MTYNDKYIGISYEWSEDIKMLTQHSSFFYTHMVWLGALTSTNISILIFPDRVPVDYSIVVGSYSFKISVLTVPITQIYTCKFSSYSAYVDYLADLLRGKIKELKIK